MRAPLLVAALAALMLVSCSSNEAEDVVLPGRETLVERYGTLAPGTFRVRQPKSKITNEGDRIVFDGSGSGIISNLSTYDLLSNNINVMDINVDSRYDKLQGATDWFGSYHGEPIGSRTCGGNIHIVETGPSITRAVFAGRCGKVDPLRGPHDFTLVEGGFAYRR